MNEELAVQLERALEDGTMPCELFGSVDDHTWLWAFTEGYRESSALREYLPGFPPEKQQMLTNGTAGDTAMKDGHRIYQVFRDLYETHRGPLEEADVLDFGCGWGRVTRFFLKDVVPHRLWG